MFCLVFSAWVVFGWPGALLLRGGAGCPAEPTGPDILGWLRNKIEGDAWEALQISWNVLRCLEVCGRVWPLARARNEGRIASLQGLGFLFIRAT